MRELVLCAIHMEIGVTLPWSYHHQNRKVNVLHFKVKLPQCTIFKGLFLFLQFFSTCFFSPYFVVVDIGQSVFKKERKKEQNFLCFDHNFECIQNETGAHQNTTLA